MSIHFVSGKPGGGKSMYGVKLIVEELTHGNRMVVTNVPLHLGRLNEYLQEKYEKVYRVQKMAAAASNGGIGSPMHEGERNWVHDFAAHITSRVCLIEEDDLGKFFTFRGNGVRLASLSNAEWKNGKRPDYSGVTDAGIFYVLDEVHIAFNARAWADTGAEVLYYLSQHRKLGDDVVCITQSVGNVDKQFRSVAQDFTYIKNLSKQRAGLFRLPAAFMRSTYAQPAKENDTPTESGFFKLDMTGIASLYDTAKGVGIHGRAGADKNARKKGVHWLFFVIGLPVIAFLFIHYLPRIIARHVAPVVPVAAVPARAEPQQKKEKSDSPALVPIAAHETEARVESQKTKAPLYCTGFCMISAKSGSVYLSDGTTVEIESGRVTRLEKTGVIIDGVALPVHSASLYYAPEVKRPVTEENRQAETEYIQPRQERPFLGGVVVTTPVGGSH
jgi:hypothetical protein